MKIIQTAKYIKTASKVFVGDCVNGLDDNYFCSKIAFDTTDLAQLVENGTQIDEQQFSTITGPDYKNNQKPGGNYSYYYNIDRGVAWFYDEDADIEYFYA